MRTVFTNQQCAHVWAQLKQPHGRSASMKFDGARAYSYATVVAHLVRLREDNPRAPDDYVALFAPNSWGVITGAHLRLYKDATSHYRQFEVPSVGTFGPPQPDHRVNVAYLTKQYRKCAEGLMRKPADSYWLADLNDNEAGRDHDCRTRAHNSLRELARVLEQYCEVFGLHTMPAHWQSDAADIIARRDRILNDPKRAEKRAKAAEQRERAEALRKEKAEAARIARCAECADLVALWRKGERIPLPFDAQRTADGSAMLRIIGDTVQTSQGAEAPLSDARAAFAVYQRVMRVPCGTWSPPELIQLGPHFQLDSINTRDGSVRAGCHFFSAAELEAFSKLVQS
jgi:hypothetical protein